LASPSFPGRRLRALDFTLGETWFAALIVAGALLRILLAVATTNSYDLAFFGSVALDGADHRPLYADTTFSYPPLWGYLFHDVGKLLAFAHITLFAHAAALEPSLIPGLTSADLTTPLASLCLKLPALLTDAGLAAALYYGARHFEASRAAARAAALGWWLNPLSLVTSPVQGSWDAIVPLATFGAIACALCESWFLAGVALAIGISAKLTPLYGIFLTPALAASGAALWSRFALARLRQGLGGALIAGAIVLAPIARWGEFGAMLHAMFARAGTFSVGGANLFAFVAFDRFHGVATAIGANRVIFSLCSFAVTLGGSSAIGILLLRDRSRRFSDYCVAAFALFALVCLASPFAQPTYVLWIVPFATYVAAAGDRRWWWIAAALSLFGFAFFVTVRAPQALLEPACIFFRACDGAAFGAQSYAYWLAPGGGGTSLQVTLNAVTGECIGIAMLAGLVLALLRLAWPHATQAAAPSAARRAASPAWRLRAACVATLLVLCAGAVLPYPPERQFSISELGRRAIVTATGYSGAVQVTAIERPAPPISLICVYFDERYPSLRGVTPTFATGFAAHFIDALETRGLSIRVRVLDAGGLRDYLSRAARGKALFVLGGTLPDTVRGPGRDLLHDWLRRGGAVFWAGGPFDLVWAHRNGPSGEPAFGGPDYSVWPTLYHAPPSVFQTRENIFFPPVAHGRYAAPAWYASRIDFHRTTFPTNTGPVQALGGRPLAYIDAHVNSSVSTLPIGDGTLVFFADGFSDEIAAAQILAQLLYVQTWSPRAQFLATDGVLTDGGPPMTVGDLPGGATLAVFGEPPGYRPFARFVVEPQLGLHAGSHSAVLRSEAYTGAVHTIVRSSRSGDPPARLYLYSDQRYPSGERVAAGFREATAGLLADDERMRELGTSVEVVDADRLRAIIAAPARDAVVVFGGILPETVRNGHSDAFRAWLYSGGTAFWAGGPFDILWAFRNASNPNSPDYTEWANLYGSGKIFTNVDYSPDPPVRRGTLQTGARHLWRSDFDRTTWALDSLALQKLGGVPLGFTDEHGASSVSVVPIGRGRLIFFGDPFQDPHEAANTLAQALFTGVYLGDTNRLQERDTRFVQNGPPLRFAKLEAKARVTAFGDPVAGPFATATAAP
jgi:hypothetical protein